MNVTENDYKKNMENRLNNFFLALFPGIVTCIVIPFSIYIPNQKDFSYDIGVMTPFFIGFCIFTGVSAILAYFFNKSRFIHWVFLFGIFLLVKDFLSPVITDGLIGQEEKVFIEEPLLSIFAEFVALAGFILIGLFTSRRVINKVLFPAAIVFIFVNASFILTQLSWSNVKSDKHYDGHPIESGIISKDISRGNVYLICLDSFLGAAFLDVINGSDLENLFDGFVYFPKNLSNYDFTLPSLASVLSGSLYAEGSMKAWHDTARWKSGLQGIFSNLGYDIWQYSGEKHDSVREVRYRTTTKKISRSNRYSLMLDAWVVRISPTMLRKEIWGKLTENNKTGFSSVSDLIVRSLEMLNNFTDEETDRSLNNQFIYVHAYIPHSPFVFDENCGEKMIEGDFHGQGLCCLRPVARFIEILKAKRIFSQSTIIIFSDHGVRGKGTEKYRDLLLNEWRKCSSGRLFPYPATMVSSLLLIKPPHSDGSVPLIISQKYSQNMDIAATLADLTDIDTLFESGQSLFSKKFPQNRTIDVFTGYGDEVYKKIKQQSMALGTIKGELGHFQFNTKTGWKCLPKKTCLW